MIWLCPRIIGKSKKTNDHRDVTRQKLPEDCYSSSMFTDPPLSQNLVEVSMSILKKDVSEGCFSKTWPFQIILTSSRTFGGNSYSMSTRCHGPFQKQVCSWAIWIQPPPKISDPPTLMFRFCVIRVSVLGFLTSDNLPMALPAFCPHLSYLGCAQFRYGTLVSDSYWESPKSMAGLSPFPLKNQPVLEVIPQLVGRFSQLVGW
jgi:hypothetical protein